MSATTTTGIAEDESAPANSAPTAAPARRNDTGDDRSVRLADVAWRGMWSSTSIRISTSSTRTGLPRCAPHSPRCQRPNERAFLDTLRRLVAALHDGHGGVGHLSTRPALPPFTWAGRESARNHGGRADRDLGIRRFAVGSATRRRGIGDQRSSHGASPRRGRVADIGGNARLAPLARFPRPSARQCGLYIDADGAPDRGRRPGVAPAENPPASAASAPAREFTVKLTGNSARIRSKNRARRRSPKSGPAFSTSTSARVRPDLNAAVARLSAARASSTTSAVTPATCRPTCCSAISFVRTSSARCGACPACAPGPKRPAIRGPRKLDAHPLAPYFTPAAPFSSTAARSATRIVLGIVEYYKLGELVGETTAGTNGNVNPIMLPGGYSVTWTGMRVLKQDGTQHHGIGIHPRSPSRGQSPAFAPEQTNSSPARSKRWGISPVSARSVVAVFERYTSGNWTYPLFTPAAAAPAQSRMQSAG